MYLISSGIVSALQRGLLEVPGVLVESITHSIAGDIVSLLEKLTLLLLGVLYGDQDTEEKGTLKLQMRSIKLFWNNIPEEILSSEDIFFCHRCASIVLWHGECNQFSNWSGWGWGGGTWWGWRGECVALWGT